MGSGSNKRNQIDMGSYTRTNEENEAYIWCIKNKILISPLAKSSTEWYIEIILNGKASKSPLTYKKVEIWKQLFSFYLYYYKKYHKLETKSLQIKKPIEQKDLTIKKDIQNKLF